MRPSPPVAQSLRRSVAKQQRAPEYLSLFIDDKLRRGSKEVATHALTRPFNRAQLNALFNALSSPCLTPCLTPCHRPA